MSSFESAKRYEKALSCMRKGENERAIQYFQEAIKLVGPIDYTFGSPDYDHYETMHAYLAKLLKSEYETKYRDIVEKCVEMIEKLQEDDLYVYQTHMIMASKRCFPPHASYVAEIHELSSLINSDPSFPYGYFLRAIVHMLYQQKSKAAQDFETFLAAAGRNMPLYKEAQQYLKKLA